jgi:hypothetical protein
MNGIVEGVAGNAIWNGICAAARRILGRQILITSPRPQETLSGGEPLGGGVCFQVCGTLKHLPSSNEIWLLTQDESTGHVWPQGFFPVQFDPEQGKWMGKVNGSGKKELKIWAVVAPPTSQDFFRYFQCIGPKRNYQFEPLKRVPAECINRAHVQAFLP